MSSKDMNNDLHISPPDNNDTPKPKKSGGKLFNNIVFVVSMCVFVVCVGILIKDFYQKSVGDDFYQNEADNFFDSINGTGDVVRADGSMSFVLASPMASKPSDFATTLEKIESGITDIVTPSHNQQLELIRAQLGSMKDKNSEIFGMLKVEGTNISYPLVRHDDNDYYLDHSTENKYLVLGSIFLDYRNKTYLYGNYNSILYGHNMTSGTMFHELERFETEKELFDTCKIYIYTMEGIYVYTPFSFYRTVASNDYIRTSFATGEEFALWANNMASRSIYGFDGEFTANHRILTLSTCINYSINNTGRFALHAVLTEIISD